MKLCLVCVHCLNSETILKCNLEKESAVEDNKPSILSFFIHIKPLTYLANAECDHV